MPGARADPDVLVVGAGAAGLWCAHFLVRQGFSVTVVERDTVGGPGAASSGNTGFVAHGGIPLAAMPDLVLAPDADPTWVRHFRSAADPARVAAAGAGLAALKRLSLALLADVAPGCGVEFGRLLVAYRKKDPVVQDGVAFLRTPDHLTALASGLDVRERTAVTGIETGRGRRVVAVHTSGGELRPAEVVVATGTCGPWIQPIRGYVLSMPPPPGAPPGPMLLADGHVAVRPLGDRLRIAGGFVATSERVVVAREVDAIRATLREQLPSLALPDTVDVWTGFRPATPDSLPLLGRPAGLDNLTLCLGGGHVGMGLAPATGRLVAQLLAGEEPDLDLTAFDPERFGRRA